MPVRQGLYSQPWRHQKEAALIGISFQLRGFRLEYTACNRRLLTDR